MARRLLVSLLKSVDFPTLGRPTIATIFPIGFLYPEDKTFIKKIGTTPAPLG
jgi:hypothetical protein